MSGYSLSHDPDVAIGTAQSNGLVVRVRVGAFGTPHAYLAPDVDVQMRSTPVEVVVTESFWGPVEAGEDLTLRILDRRDSAEPDDAVPLDAFVVGAEFIVFAQPVVTVDGVAAATPNHVYRIDGGRAVDIFGGIYSVDANEFIARLREQAE